MKIQNKGKSYTVPEFVDKYIELEGLFRRYIKNVEECEGYDFINGMPEEDQIALNKIKEGK